MRIYQKIAPQASARASLQAGADEDRASLEKMRRLQLRVSGDQAGSRDTEVHKGYHASRGGRVKAGVSGLSRLKKILYRPLWVSGILAVGALVYFYALTPHRQGGEFDGTGVPSGTTTQPLPATLPPPGTTAGAKVAAPEPTKSRPAPGAAADVDPLVISVTVDDEQTAMRRINEVMQGHATLRNMRFTDAVKEISGSLTSKELLTFFNRIEQAGKIHYSHARLVSFPAATPVPFIMRLKAAPRPVERPIQQSGERPAEKTGDKSLEKPAPEAVR